MVGNGGIDDRLRLIRETVAAMLAGIVVLGTLVVFIVAFQYVDSQNQQSFERVKDLLLMINPIVGVVIGYYFSKVTTEARAESAEATAKAATQVAHQAESEARASRQEADQAKTKLGTLSQAAQRFVSASQGVAAPGVLGGNGDTPAMAEARMALRMAIEDAQRIAP
jgi:uncharacterized protein (UPF0261 family)